MRYIEISGMEKERERDELRDIYREVDGAEMDKQPIPYFEPHNNPQRKSKQREIGGMWFNTIVPSDHFFWLFFLFNLDRVFNIKQVSAIG